VDEGVGCERPLAAIDAERLPRLGFAFEGVQAQTDGRRLHLKQHVQLGEPFGVVEELRIRLRPLPTAGSGYTTHERVRGASRPDVERSRALLPIGTAATDQTELGQPLSAVAERPSGRVGEQAFELGLFLIYAAVGLAKSESITREDVHNAWAAWMAKRSVTRVHQAIRSTRPPYEV
jgi:hypothetical protein